MRKRLKASLVQALKSLTDEIFLFESRNIFRWRQNRALCGAKEAPRELLLGYAE